ncbi:MULTISPECIES: sodium:solute symporter family protein [unclassified Sedimentibacter]|uniref:sodium:solute symporter family protein n=1 Tax=unclassified Sedimentibacter TaxID=2649220 RepID=UPI0027E0D1A3|nr:sodium:solute symporter family protein [Sedimentibacter sp. MB35-C1]WMJ77736.1 sodium:solute symporter family protein [Sedimentibacter sp. MB35-C1]
MNLLSFSHIIGFTVTLICIALTGVYSGKQIKNESDFTTGGGKASSLIIMGAIIGTLVGGASTVGTAQLAYTYGFSSIWFTLGGSIGCFVMAVFFAKPLRGSDCRTIQQIISEEYGKLPSLLSSLLGSLGIFINIVAQILSAMALLKSMTPLAPTICAVISIGLMASYVLFGGVLGAGVVGIAKTILLYVSVITGGILAISLSGGLSTIVELLPKAQYFNLFARGVGIDLGAGLSLVFGVLSTQTYIQAVLSGRNDKTAIRGALMSSLLIPPIGAGGVFIGMFMKLNYPNIDPAQSFPIFVINHMPSLFGGLVLATLLIAIVGTGAGLSLGISTIINNDIIRCFTKVNPKKNLLLTRFTIIAILLIAMIFTTGTLQSVILKWSFMSMGLRAAVSFFPMFGALFLPKKINTKFVIASIIISPISILISEILFDFNFDTLFIGLGFSFILMTCGYFINGNKQGINSTLNGIEK